MLSISPEPASLGVAAAVGAIVFLLAAGWLALTLPRRHRMWTLPLECASPGLTIGGFAWWSAMNALQAQPEGAVRCGVPLVGALIIIFVLGGGGLAAGASLLLAVERRRDP